jgi:hypothetical protein
MAFGYRYWMVFLPEIEPHSFLLFVHNPAGATKLRNYASGRERVVGQPDADKVFRDTEVGRTRHECDPHKTDDHSFWYQRTQELNRRYLRGADGGSPPPTFEDLYVSPRPRKSVRYVWGRARRGSQRQLQDYVNVYPDALSQAILDQLPNRVRELGAKIRWVSPLAGDAYREYRDADFLTLVGLGGHARDLAEFWPSMGPSWDALGIISDPDRRMKPGVILVEAKSHIPEIYGSGCQASPESLVKIEAAIGHARSWCDASTGENWLGPLYQSANRIAHLYWLYERLRTPAWLVNLYFTGDPIGPADRPQWEREVASVKTQLGLTRPVPNVIEVYLPALGDANAHDPHEILGTPELEEAARSAVPVADPFELWARRWMDLARFAGPHLTEPAQRIKQVLELWDAPVPGSWERGIDDQLLRTRYRRGDVDSPHAGEHSIEHEILSQLEAIRCLDGNLVDGINAMPLTRDETGGRCGNVEGDLFLLREKGGMYQLVVCEVKSSANTCWYAAIESLRQLKLLHLSTAARQLFHHRNRHLSLPAEIPIIGLVVAPEQYYRQPGQKSNVLPHTIRLLNEFREKTGIEAHLAAWDASLRVIRKF